MQLIFPPVSHSMVPGRKHASCVTLYRTYPSVTLHTEIGDWGTLTVFVYCLVRTGLFLRPVAGFASTLFEG